MKKLYSNWPLLVVALGLFFGWKALVATYDLLGAIGSLLTEDGTGNMVFDASLDLLFYGGVGYLLWWVFTRHIEKVDAYNQSNTPEEAEPEEPSTLDKFATMVKKEPTKTFFLRPFHDEKGVVDSLDNFCEKDPRFFDVSSNSGYQYTTGESSGSLAGAQEDGAIELTTFSCTCLEKHYPIIERAYTFYDSGKDQRRSFSLHMQNGNPRYFAELEKGLKDQGRAFSISWASTQPSEGADVSADGQEDYIFTFRCHINEFEALKATIDKWLEQKTLADTKIHLQIS